MSKTDSMSTIHPIRETSPPRMETLKYHRGELKTEATAQIPPMKGVLLLACRRYQKPDLRQIEGGFWRHLDRPPWFCVWPRTGVAALGLPPVRVTLVRFQSCQVWIDPRPPAAGRVDLGWRNELGFEEGLGDRRLQSRNPIELAATPVGAETCVCHGDNDDAAGFTFPHCHQIWVVADWVSGRNLSIIGCEYIFDPKQNPDGTHTEIFPGSPL